MNSVSTLTELEELRERSQAAQFHGPYLAKGKEVSQANFHPSFGRGYMLCSGLASEPAAQSVADTLNDHMRMLNALESILSECSTEEDATRVKDENHTDSEAPNFSLMTTSRIRQIITEALNADVNY